MNREHVVELDIMQDVGAIVLGGGRGTRLHPLTALRAKPAVPLLGRYRLVDIPLSNCIHSGVKRIVVLTQFNSASLNRHINHSYKFDNFSRGFVEVLAAEQTIESGDWFQGTADAIRKQLRHVRNMQAKYYLILSGDQLYRMNYRKLMATHLNSGADITVAALPVTRKDASSFGIMQVQPQGRIRHFVEKPTQDAELDNLVTPKPLFERFGFEQSGKEYLASMGVYVFNAALLESILEERADWIDFGKDVIPNSLNSRKVFAHLYQGFWEDIGTVQSYYDTSLQMAMPNPPFEFHDPNHIIYTHPRYLPGSHLFDATVSNSIICEGCVIHKSTIAESIIGIRSNIKKGATIEQSIIMGADQYSDERENDAPIPVGIGEKSIIKRAIIDKNAHIGKNVHIQGSKKLPDQDGDGFAIRDGIVVVFKNAVIPNNTRIV